MYKESLEGDLPFVGLVGMIDPPRPEARDAVRLCKRAGIKPVMITGDHKITAIAIAKDLGILEHEGEAVTGTEIEKMSDEELKKNVHRFSVYARVFPLFFSWLSCWCRLWRNFSRSQLWME